MGCCLSKSATGDVKVKDNQVAAVNNQTIEIRPLNSSTENLALLGSKPPAIRVSPKTSQLDNRPQTGQGASQPGTMANPTTAANPFLQPSESLHALGSEDKASKVRANVVEKGSRILDNQDLESKDSKRNISVAVPQGGQGGPGLDNSQRMEDFSFQKGAKSPNFGSKLELQSQLNPVEPFNKSQSNSYVPQSQEINIDGSQLKQPTLDLLPRESSVADQKQSVMDMTFLNDRSFMPTEHKSQHVVDDASRPVVEPFSNAYFKGKGSQSLHQVVPSNTNWLSIAQISPTSDPHYDVDVVCSPTENRNPFEAQDGSKTESIKETLTLTFPSTNLGGYLQAYENLREKLLKHRIEALSVLFFTNSAEEFTISWKNKKIVSGNKPKDIETKETLEAIIEALKKPN